MHYFCETCEKIVPEEEVSIPSASFKKALAKLAKLNPHAAKAPASFQSEPHRTHVYKQTVNVYKNQAPGTIGCCLVEETVYCGKVREPTDHEYFIFHTCKANP